MIIRYRDKVKTTDQVNDKFIDPMKLKTLITIYGRLSDLLEILTEEQLSNIVKLTACEVDGSDKRKSLSHF